MAGVRDIIHSFVFMVNKCEMITQCLEVCYEYNLPFDKVYYLIEQVRECIDDTILDCQKYLKNKEHDEVSAILNKCISYQDEFLKSPSKTRVAKLIYKDNKRWYDNLDSKRQPWYKQKIKLDKEMAIAFCQNKVEYKISNCSDDIE
ncbi:MAG: hypothetical protein ACI3ZD_14650 [Prevotella sp.]